MARVKLGDVAREYKATIKDTAALPIVGLEHLTPGEITLERWDVGTENTFTKGFKKGHMLFGRRRAYLKKAALAPFDGVCSGDITVIEAIPGKINPELLPFIIQNDLLFDYAVGNSAGSLSPRVKWESLKGYEFELPELAEQDGLVELLKAAHRTKKAYQKQITATDELVKSQFIEQFVLDKSHPREQLRENIVEMFIGPFGSALKNDCFVEEADAYCMVYEQKHAIQKSMDLPTRYVDEKKFRELARFNIQPGDVIVSCRGTIGEVFVVPDDAPIGIMHPSIMKVRLNRKRYNNVFFALLLEHYMEEHKQEANGTGVKMAVSASTLEKECFVIPEKGIQDAFVAFAEQSDKSKFELQEAIVRIDNFIKSLIQQDDN